MREEFDDADEGGGGMFVRPFLDRVLLDAEDGDEPPPGPALRPFLLTEGRVPDGSSNALAIEAQVISTDYGYDRQQVMEFERRDIVSLCTVPLSVAEVSARLSLHLHVVRVLVADLCAEGYLYAYLPHADAAQDIDTILRVIHGLRAIS